ncbi:hypothetical protein [Xanthomonas phage BUDD]|nr:hypothetical protein [Xanthomonas phage BUDD]
MSQAAALEKLIEAAEHAYKVFLSLAERGEYPQELLPFDGEGKDSPLFMGHQGLMFLINAIKEAKAAKQPQAFVADMKTSSGMEYYVMLGTPDRNESLFMFKSRGRAEFTAAEVNYSLGIGDQPDVLDYDA